MVRLITSLVFFSALSASAEGPSCEVLRDRWFNKYIRDFAVAWTPPAWNCNDDGLVAEAIYHLEMDTYRPNSGGYTPTFYTMVSNGISSIGWDANCTYLGYVSHGTKRITLCPPFLTKSVENRTATLIHEYAHTENGDPGHVRCVGGPFDGQSGGCDQYFYDGRWEGSGYNADIHYFAWARNNGANLNGLSRAVLLSEIRALVPDRFNNVTEAEITKWRAE